MTREEGKAISKALVGLISAVSAIEKDGKTHDRFMQLCRLMNDALKEPNMAIEALKQPEIVRCGECKWRKLDTRYGSNEIVCNRLIISAEADAKFVFDENHFCGYGERRTE
jgi:hypothetical protein